MINDFKLFFKEPLNDYNHEVGVEYKQELKKLQKNAAQILTLVGAILVPLSATIDYYAYPDYLLDFFRIRIIISIVCFYLCFLSHKKRYENYGVHIVTIGIFAVGLGLSSIIRCLGYDTPYYAGLNLIYLACMIVPWTMKMSLICCVVVYSFYLTPILLFDLNKIDISIFVINNLFQIETIIIAAVVNFFLFKIRKREIINLITISKQANELRETNKRIKEAEKSKIEFIANLSHDLKSPLTVLAGHVDFLHKILPPDTKEWNYLKYMKSSVNQLFRFIQKLIDIALIDKHEDKPNLEYIDYKLLIKTYAESFRELADQKNIRYNVNLENKETVIQVDISWVERILGNIITNAFKFTNPGDSISIKTFSDNEFIYTEISDTGIGIKDDNLAHIFERKYQTSDGIKKKGSGLGLYIVKERLKLMGGEISVASKHKKGTTFKVSMPLFMNQNVSVVNQIYKGNERRRIENDRRMTYDRRLEERLRDIHENVETMQEVESVEFDESRFENQNPTKPTILICDDTPGQMNLIIEILKGDYNLLFARDGYQGLKKANENKDMISLIISDVRMPNMDGLEFCRLFFGQHENQKIPFIFLTAYSSENEHFKGLQLGATDYLTKPINAHIMREKIIHWVSKRSNELLLKDFARSLEDKVDEVLKLQSVLSHEIRNPLAIISLNIAFLNKLRDKYLELADDKEQRMWRSVENIKTAQSSITTIIQSTKDIHNIDQSSLKPISISDLINMVQTQASHFFDNINFNVDYDIDIESTYILCEKNLLCQVFVNLLRNSVEALSNKSDGFVNIIINKEYNKINCLIKDNGIGISPKDLQNLFRFKYTTKGASGNGIGLYFSRIIVKLHNGEITVKSKINEGTEFKVSLMEYNDNFITVN